MKKCYFIYNPESGKHDIDDNIDNIEYLLQKNGFEVIWMPTKYSGHAIKMMTEIKDADLVISCGGDGTLNEVVTGNMVRSNKLLLGHLPTGTTNDIGNMYGYTGDTIYDLKLLLNGVVKDIDVCTINDRPFIYVGCLGTLVDVAYNTPRDLKKKLGRFGYIINGLSELKQDIKTYDIDYTVDGKTYSKTASYIFISNTSSIGGFKNIYDDVKLDDNMFEVVIVDLMKKAELIVALTGVLTGNIKKLKGVHYYKTSKLDIKFKNGFNDSWCIDGEEFCSDDNLFSIKVNKGIKMVVPNKNVDELFE